MKYRKKIIKFFLFIVLVFSFLLYAIITNNKMLERTKSSINSFSSNADSTQTLKVLIVEVDPTLKTITDTSLYSNRSGGHPRVSDFLGEDLDSVIQDAIQDLEDSSNGYLNVKVVGNPIVINEFSKYNEEITLKNNTKSYMLDEETFLDMSRVPGKNYGSEYDMRKNAKFIEIYNQVGGANIGIPTTNHKNHKYDYDYIIDKLDLVNRRNNGEFDHVWIFNTPPNGYYETLMVGRTAYYINGEPIKKDCDNFVIETNEIGRGDAFLHQYSHMIENIIRYAYNTEYEYTENMYNINSKTNFNKLNDWQKFTLNAYNNNNTNYTGVGNTHFPFNGITDYDYENTTKVKTNWREWLDYPNVTGSSFVYDNNDSWKNADINKNVGSNRTTDNLYQRFLLSLMPHIEGITSDGHYRNWWKYFYSLDFVNKIEENNLPTNYIGSIGVLYGNVVPFNFSYVYQSGEKKTIKKLKNEPYISISDTSVLGYNSSGYLYGKKIGTSDVTIYRDADSITYKVNVVKAGEDAITINHKTYAYDGEKKDFDISSLSGTHKVRYFNNSTCSDNDEIGYTGFRPSDEGEYYVIVYSKGNSDYYGTITECTKALTIKPKHTCPTITGGTYEYDGQQHEVNISGTGSGTVYYKTKTQSDSEWTTTKPYKKNVGEANVCAKIKEDSTHAETICSACDAKITITKKEVKVTAANKTMYYGNSLPNFTYSLSGTVENETAVSGTATYTIKDINGNVVNANSKIAAGNYTIIPSGLTAGSNYSIKYVPGTLVVSKKTPTCPTIADNTVEYDGQKHSIVILNNGTNLNKKYRTASSVTEWQDEIPTRTSVGTGTVFVMLEGNEEYDSRECGSAKITITKKEVKVTAANKTMYYGNSLPNFTYSLSGAVENETAVSGTATYTIKDINGNVVNANSKIAAGNYTIIPSGLTAGSNYSIKYVSGTLVVSKKTPTCPTITDNTVEYDGQKHTIIVGNDGTNLNKKYRTASSIIEWQDEIPTRTSVGTGTVLVMLEGNEEYDSRECGSAKIIVTKAIDEISIKGVVTANYDGTEKNVLFNSKTTVTPTYYSDSTCKNSISGNPINVGTYYVTAESEGNNNYEQGHLNCTKAVVIKDSSTPNIDNLNIKKSTYAVFNINDSYNTIIELLGTNERVIVKRNNTPISDNITLKTNDILTIGNISYIITIKGDLNLDGKITITDVSKLYRHVNGNLELNEIEKIIGDFNENDSINITDVSAIYRNTKK